MPAPILPKGPFGLAASLFKGNDGRWYWKDKARVGDGAVLGTVFHLSQKLDRGGATYIEEMRLRDFEIKSALSKQAEQLGGNLVFVEHAYVSGGVAFSGIALRHPQPGGVAFFRE